MEEGIRVLAINPLYKEQGTSNNTSQATQNQPFNAGSSVVAVWHVQYQHELISTNKMIRPDGFSSIELENIGDDDCQIFGGIPLTPKDKGRKYENRPGEIITTQIPINFAGESENKKVYVTKTYYERAIN